MNKKYFFGLILVIVGIFLIIYGISINNNIEFEEDSIFVFKEHQISVVLDEKRVLLLYNEDDNSNVIFASTDENVVKVDENGIITAVGEGMALITAESKTTSDSATCIIVVNKDNLNKEITNLSLNMNNLDLNIGTSSKLIPIIEPINALNKELVWSTSNPNIASVNQNGTVKAISSGVVDITVRSKNNKVATCKVKVKTKENEEDTKIINVSNIELNKNSLSLELSKSYSLSYKITPSNATDQNVIWSSTNPDIAIVNEKGQVKAIREGVTTIIATTKDGGKTAKCTVIVKYTPISVTGISLNTNNITLNTNETYTLVSSITPNNADNKNVLWTSSNNSVVTVNSQGVVTGLKEGNATITATTKDGGKTAKCTVTVKYLPNVVTGVTLNKDNITLNLNESSTLIANVNPSNANNKKVSWTSDNPSVATVNSSGVVTGIKTGIATIKVTTLDGNKTATCKVKVGTKLIFIGDSRVNRLAGYDGKYSINYRGRDKVFIEKGGTKHSDWFSSNSSLMNKVDVTVSKLGGVRCAIIIGLAGNDLNITTASSVSEGRQKIISLTEKYNTSLVDLAHKYNNLCTIYFTSVNPVQLNKKYTVYSYDSTSALTKKGRSNSKIETFNNSIKNLILQDNITNLKYVDTSSYFVEYKDKLKNGYNTSDGTHYNEKTAQLVYDKILELTGL